VFHDHQSDLHCAELFATANNKGNAMSPNTPIPTTAGATTRRQISIAATGDLIPVLNNPRKNSRAQIRTIARSIEAVGLNAPILIDRNRKIVAGDRYEVGKPLGYGQVCSSHCKIRVYKINRALDRFFFSTTCACDLVRRPEHELRGTICRATIVHGK
jgi:hypothetical protein